MRQILTMESAVFDFFAFGAIAAFVLLNAPVFIDELVLLLVVSENCSFISQFDNWYPCVKSTDHLQGVAAAKPKSRSTRQAENFSHHFNDDSHLIICQRPLLSLHLVALSSISLSQLSWITHEILAPGSSSMISAELSLWGQVLHHIHIHADPNNHCRL